MDCVKREYGLVKQEDWVKQECGLGKARVSMDSVKQECGLGKARVWTG